MEPSQSHAFVLRHGTSLSVSVWSTNPVDLPEEGTEAGSGELSPNSITMHRKAPCPGGNLEPSADHVLSS